MMALQLAPTTATSKGGFKNKLRAVRTYMINRRAYNSVVRELSALDDRTLNDLGISRYDIHAVARSATQ